MALIMTSEEFGIRTCNEIVMAAYLKIALLSINSRGDNEENHDEPVTKVLL
jgi:hypothetical protein